MAKPRISSRIDAMRAASHKNQNVFLFQLRRQKSNTRLSLAAFL